MKIAVCVKRVPESLEVGINPTSRTVDTSGINFVLNPNDEYAVEEALRLKEAHQGSVTAVSVGSPEAAEVVRQAIGMGADDGVVISDGAMDAADGLGVANALAGAIRKLQGVDLVICGRQGSDTATGIVPAALAEFLGWPAVSWVKKIEEVALDHIVVQTVTDFGYDRVRVSLPCVISVVKEINEPRLASLRGLMKAKKTPVPVWSLADLGLDAQSVAPQVQVNAVARPPERAGGAILTGTVNEQVATLLQKLAELKLI